MDDVTYEIRVNGDAYTSRQIEAMRFEREKHVLQELIHYDVAVQKDGEPLSFDDINYLTREEASRVLLQAKQAMNASETQAVYREAPMRLTLFGKTRSHLGHPRTAIARRSPRSAFAAWSSRSTWACSRRS